MADKHPSIIAPLTGLKDFQQRTVNYVFQQFYGDKQQNRFLVADEVGLGKTMVARGIIAKASNIYRIKLTVSTSFISVQMRLSLRRISSA